ncbi:hypothetical protein TNCV_4091581 [Trichonephila clavipes]|nr:hypothetical protein TNCV_4091581 [Trichonephila clavipes]
MSDPSLPCAQFACPHVKWCTEVDAIDYVGPSYPPISNGHISALQLFGFVQHDYRFFLKVDSKKSFNPLSGYLPPEKLFRKRLTLILEVRFKNAADFFPFPLLEFGRSNGDNFITKFSSFVKSEPRDQSFTASC